MGIRHATERDLAAIVEITNHAIAKTTAVWSLTPATVESRRAWMRDRQNRGFPVILIEEDGAVQGFASYGDFRAHEGYLYTVELSLYVHPAAQRRGYGRQMLDALVMLATKAGKHAMVAGIEAHNAASIALHAQAGFVEVARLPEVGRKFDRWLDLVFMQKLLPTPRS